MTKIKRSNWQFLLASQLRRGAWLIHEPQSSELLQLALQTLKGSSSEIMEAGDLQILASADGESFSDFNQVQTRSVAIIPLKGTMLKYDTLCSVGTSTIANLINECAQNELISGVVLDTDSPGGARNSIPCLLQSIDNCHNAGKPVVAHADFCCSAAMWVASRCKAIVVNNSISSELGSIGVVATIVDDAGNLEKDGYKVHTIYPPESSEKNRAYRNVIEGDYGKMEKYLSEAAVMFQEAIKANRPGLKLDTPGILNGETFNMKESIEAGLADCQGNLSHAINLANILSDVNIHP